MTNANAADPWVLAGLLLVLSLMVALLLARKTPLQLIGRALFFVGAPFRLIFRRGSAMQRNAVHDVAELGASAWAPTARFFRNDTDLERALGDDFEHERAHLRRRGAIFNWLQIDVNYITIPEELTAEVSREYNRLSHEFLAGRVPIGSDPKSLYEDVEGAVIATQFKESDDSAFYLMDRMRRMVNSNVRKLTVWFSAILSSVLIVNVLYNTGEAVDFHAMMGLSERDGLLSREHVNHIGFGLLSSITGAVLMWVLYFVEYTPYQRNNMREFANFLTRYMARINDHYRTAAGRANSVTVGQERDVGEIVGAAKLWHANVIWLGLRAYFIETMVRNTLYQITRNSSFYLALVPLAFLVAILCGGLLASSTTSFDLPGRIADLGWVFGLLFITVAAIYGSFLGGAMICLREVDQGEWVSFHSLRFNQVLSELVGKYAEDVGYWKNRVGGGI